VLAVPIAVHPLVSKALMTSRPRRPEPERALLEMPLQKWGQPTPSDKYGWRHGDVAESRGHEAATWKVNRCWNPRVLYFFFNLSLKAKESMKKGDRSRRKVLPKIPWLPEGRQKWSNLIVFNLANKVSEYS